MPLITLVAVCIFGLAQARDDHSSTKSHSSATFELEVKRSDAMSVGKTKLICVSVFATAMHRQGRAKFTGIDVFFAPKTTDSRIPQSAKEIRQGDYANLNLLTDTTGRVTQVNMTVVAPGKTVARTIAWKADDLRKYFSDVNLTSKKIVLKSKGIYNDAESESEQTRLQWDVDIDIPITNDVE